MAFETDFDIQAEIPLGAIEFNFIKLHMALEGQTPANAAGIEVKGWMELLK